MNNSIKVFTTLFFLAISAAVAISAHAETLSEQDAQAVKKYQQARQTYLNEVEFYKGARQELLNARQKYDQYRSAQDKAVLEQKAKEFLKSAVLTIMRRLEVLRNKAENVRGISDSDRALVLVEIDKDMDWLKDRQGKIDSATPAQIKEQAKAALDHWKDIRIAAKRITGEILAARIDFVIGKAESLSIQVSAKITELKSSGKDTSKLETWLSDLNQKIALAKEKYELAKTKFQAISNLAAADRLFQEGHQFIKDADQYIRQARTQLVQIIKEMKKIGAETIPSSATSTE